MNDPSTGSTNWLARAAQVACEVLARHADDVDRNARWPAESMAAVAEAGLLGLTVPRDCGAEQGPATFASVTSLLADLRARLAQMQTATDVHAAFSRHVSVERNFRDARAAAVMAPTTDVLHDFIGKAVLGLPLF